MCFSGQLAEHQIFDILREKLYSTPCRNQGFVLDGFPETSEQAKMIFSGKFDLSIIFSIKESKSVVLSEMVLLFCSDEEPENLDSDVMSKVPWYNDIITPGCGYDISLSTKLKCTNPQLLKCVFFFFHICFAEHVFVLDASDDFLTKRVQGLPESTAEKMSYTQEEFVPRLARYRQLFSMEETLLDFFDHREIHPLCIGTVCKTVIGHK